MSNQKTIFVILSLEKNLSCCATEILALRSVQNDRNIMSFLTATAYDSPQKGAHVGGPLRSFQHHYPQMGSKQVAQSEPCGYKKWPIERSLVSE